jgi:N-acetyl-alpha-D-glucosaminyl L-malate synthase BshA
MRKISIAVASPPIGTSLEAISYNFVFDEAYRLAKKGIDVHVVRGVQGRTSQRNGIYFHDLEKLVDTRALGSVLRRLPMYPPISLLRKPETIYWENLRALRLSEVIKNYKIDLIHAHFAYPEGVVGLLSRKETKKPLVVTVHGNDILVEPNCNYGIRLSRRIDAMVRKVLNDADLVIAASNATFNEVRKIIKKTDKVHLVPNGVDTEEFCPNLDSSLIKKKLGIEEQRVVFTLRNHRTRYGIEYLIRAAPLVIKERDDVVFLVGGDGPLRDFHERLAVNLGVKDKVIFVGRIPENQKPHYFAMSDIVVIPSLQEAFGLVVSEAMACEKPVIGSRVGGIPDQIIDGFNGFLVQPGNPREIAEKVLWLLDKPSKAESMGIRGREIAVRKFNIERRMEHILLLYQKLLEKQDQS